MLKKIAELKKILEEENFGPLPQEEIDYLEQISSTKDLANYDKSNEVLRNLAYDASISLGLTEEQANHNAGEVNQAESTRHHDHDYDGLEKEYKMLISNLNILEDILHDGESAIIEEVSREGFASQKTRNKVQEVRNQWDEAKSKLDTFKCNNSDFIAWLKQKKEAQKAEDKNLFKAFWN